MSHPIEFQVLSLRMVAVFVDVLAELERDGLIEREVAIRLRSWYASRHPRHRIGNKAVFATAPHSAPIWPPSKNPRQAQEGPKGHG